MHVAKGDQQPEVGTETGQHGEQKGDQQRRYHHGPTTLGVRQIAPEIRAGYDARKADRTQHTLLAAAQLHLAAGRRQHEADGQRLDDGRRHDDAADDNQVEVEFANLYKYGCKCAIIVI